MQLYLDLDHTLFNTDQANLRFGQVVEALFGITPAQLAHNQTAFSVQVGGGQHFYRFFAQLASIGIAIDRAKQQMHQALMNEDFLYPDARYLLSYLEKHNVSAKVLSLGDPDFQSFKYSLVPELQQYPFICVQALKGEYFQAHASEPAMIVDDMHIAALPEGCRGVLIDRTQAIRLQQQDDYCSINSLTVVKDLL